MTTRTTLLLRIALAVWGCNLAHAAPSTPAVDSHATYIDRKLQFPTDYREWIYLSTGLDMSYSRIALPDHHMFDNVFVNPQAYRVFRQTGSWPDGTMLVLETRGARDKGSINQHGLFQDDERMGVEVHLKDSARFDGGWAFFGFDDDQPASEIRHSAGCYDCHRSHAAVDTTFVQFYPTLLSIAKAANTFSASYLEDLKARAHAVSEQPYASAPSMRR